MFAQSETCVNSTTCLDDLAAVHESVFVHLNNEVVGMMCVELKFAKFGKTTFNTPTLWINVRVDIRFWSFKSNRNSNENGNKNATGEDTYVGALRAPRAGSPACVFVFVFV